MASNKLDYVLRYSKICKFYEITLKLSVKKIMYTEEGKRIAETRNKCGILFETSGKKDETLQAAMY